MADRGWMPAPRHAQPIGPARASLAIAPIDSPPSAASPSPPLIRRYSDLSDCVDHGPPGAACQHTECRYHLAHRGYWEHHLKPTRDCAIDVANEGPHTLDEVAAVLGVSGERARQIEEQALAYLKHNPTLKGLHDESSE